MKVFNFNFRFLLPLTLTAAKVLPGLKLYLTLCFRTDTTSVDNTTVRYLEVKLCAGKWYWSKVPLLLIIWLLNLNQITKLFSLSYEFAATTKLRTSSSRFPSPWARRSSTGLSPKRFSATTSRTRPISKISSGGIYLLDCFHIIVI